MPSTVDRSHVLVAPYVAAEMTDLLQTAVNTGTGKAAQIGRPVAGKTGTTTSNKDGWFLGFSSGLTTGVWMGRDDAARGARPAGRHRAGARLRRLHEGRRRQSPGRAVRDRGDAARMAARARRGSLFRRARQRPVRRRERQSRRARCPAAGDRGEGQQVDGDGQPITGAPDDTQEPRAARSAVDGSRPWPRWPGTAQTPIPGRAPAAARSPANR